ncbi:flagellar motor protein MotB [Gudongella oleilytica]|jgi:chemotaxis protein MotB|uniref:flagellar motor protein MotB n=1 Tax=Gudongella oleilytica TaxID=1582259 RepID=UPI002A35F942|nr:flagellar motor protein MotB [Gudongella oleilytica]MDY0256565.1 flagellar motor protein MotB [Gudongella oleilytica]
MSRFKKKQSGGSPGWITTFSDMMSLLLTFFILLYSISTVDAQKFRNITQYLQIALSGDGRPHILDGGTETVPEPFDEEPFSETEIPPEEMMEPVNAEILQMYEKINKYITDLDLQAEVNVMMISSGVFVEIKDAILFESGSAQLKDTGIELLGKLENMLNDFDNDIVIEGHTDNVPMNSAMYPSNWELSAARAVSVLRYLNEEMNVEPTRLSARGYGEYSPIAPNDTATNRSRNRRVNIMIVFEKEGAQSGQN